MGYFWRGLIAALVLLFLMALEAPVLGFIGFHLDANLMQIIRICVVAIAIFYVVDGPSWKVWPWNRPA